KGPPATRKDEADKLIGEARAALDSGEWAKARSTAGRALAVDGQSAEARKIEDRATVELQGQQAFKKFMDARDAGRLVEALKAVQNIPKESTYRDKAEASAAKVKDQYIQRSEQEAKRLAAKGQCDAARKQGDAVPEAHALAEKAARSC